MAEILREVGDITLQDNRPHGAAVEWDLRKHGAKPTLTTKRMPEDG